ncbi:uncharacterized protein [Nicotiana sylvestris]|uniref:uncharacterized protein n=1 Tax=Nicotiana sylvestris TaxID=4096 RepID=UPI00388C3BC1
MAHREIGMNPREGTSRSPSGQRDRFPLEAHTVLWYEACERSRGPDALPAEWEDFSEAFFVHYFPREVREARLDQFLSLKHGDMSVRDYSHKFNSLARYAPDIVRTMRARGHHNVDGLGGHLIRDCRVASLLDDVDISRIQVFAQTTEDLSRRIRDTRRDREQSKRDRTMGSYRETRGDFKPPLHRYPPRSADPGSTFSYITPFIAGKLDMRSELLPQPIEVSTPVGDSIVVNHVYRGCTVLINDRPTSVDLVKLVMLDSDVIMGIDWMAACYANIDCRAKLVRFHFPGEPGLEWKSNAATPKDKEPATLQSVPMVNEFPTVFVST